MHHDKPEIKKNSVTIHDSTTSEEKSSVEKSIERIHHGKKAKRLFCGKQ